MPTISKSNQSLRSNQAVSKSLITFEEKVFLEHEGTLGDFVPQGFKLKLSDANLASENRVVIILDNGNRIGKITCSKALSSQIRSALKNGFQKKEILARLTEMPVSKNSEGVPFVISEGSDGFSIEELRSIDLNEVPF